MLKEILKNIKQKLEKHQQAISTIASCASTILVFLIGFQIIQSYYYKKCDNFLLFNNAYEEWHEQLPDEISANEATSFKSLDNAGKEWVRRYFNLYAQEYYFYKKGMIPKEMWREQLHGCKKGKLSEIFRNLKRYPALLQGYCEFKNNDGAFSFPSDFTRVFEDELCKCAINVHSICDNANYTRKQLITPKQAP